jgi:hypothetical protein
MPPLTAIACAGILQILESIVKDREAADALARARRAAERPMPSQGDNDNVEGGHVPSPSATATIRQSEETEERCSFTVLGTMSGARKDMGGYRVPIQTMA